MDVQRESDFSRAVYKCKIVFNENLYTRLQITLSITYARRSTQLPFHIINPQVVVANVEVSEGNVAFSTIKLSHKVDFQKLQSALLHTDAIDFAGYWRERPTVHSSVSKRFPAW